MKRASQAIAAAAALPVAVKAAEGEDSELLALWPRLQERYARAHQLQEEEDRSIDSGQKAELFERGVLVSREATEIERQIAAIPANTFAGLAIKLRIGTDNQSFRTDLWFQEDDATTDELNLMTAFADAERLAGLAS